MRPSNDTFTAPIRSRKSSNAADSYFNDEMSGGSGGAVGVAGPSSNGGMTYFLASGGPEGPSGSGSSGGSAVGGVGISGPSLQMPTMFGGGSSGMEFGRRKKVERGRERVREREREKERDRERERFLDVGVEVEESEDGVGEGEDDDGSDEEDEVEESVDGDGVRDNKRDVSSLGIRTPELRVGDRVPSSSDLESVFTRSPGRSYPPSEPEISHHHQERYSRHQLQIQKQEEARQREQELHESIHQSQLLARQELEEMAMGSGLDITTPQLIMPTIKMPSRRPFTEKGKRIGKLKILIAGDSGIGKTTLIKSIVQICEDIVHVDPLTTPSGFGGASTNSSYYSLSNRAEGESTKRITEVYASTRPYPHWWSEYDESKVLRRRRSSSGESVLERNLCFVDTPGYGFGSSSVECVEPVVKYVEAQLEKTNSIITTGDGDLLSLLAGDGAPQVDVVFYIILHRLKPVDVEYMKRLSPIVNVLPVIAKADTLNEQQTKQLKLSILNDLRAAGIKPFLFGKSYEDVLRNDEPCPPYAISSAIDNDIENMDASVLMSPDYVPPLVSTELSTLVSRVFDPETITWLKHLSAKKFLAWRSSQAQAASAQSLLLNSTLSLPNSHPLSPSPSSQASSSSLIPHPSSPSPTSFVLARVADHTQREERLAQIRLARWAADLQRTLADERARYEAMAKGERALWLTERLGEAVRDGQLVPVSTGPDGKTRYRLQKIRPGKGDGQGGYKADPWGIVGRIESWEQGKVWKSVGGVVAVLAVVWAWREFASSVGVVVVGSTEAGTATATAGVGVGSGLGGKLGGRWWGK